MIFVYNIMDFQNVYNKVDWSIRFELFDQCGEKVRIGREDNVVEIIFICVVVLEVIIKFVVLLFVFDGRI